jgi:hypothetical protein
VSRVLTSFTRTRGAVQTGGDLGASTRSSKDISSNPGALGEAVEDDVRARALLVESSDLGLTVADSRLNLGAEVAVHHSLKHNLDEVASLALSLKVDVSSQCMSHKHFEHGTLTLSLPHVASTKGKVRKSW